VGLPDDETRIDVMRRAIPYLPILLLLSCSSPFWRGMSSGFASYRLTSYDELPRTGLPPLFTSWAEYQDYAQVLIKAGIIRNESYIWWALRPSYKYPTLELRIPDACTHIEDALTIAALYRCLVRALVLDRTLNASLASAGRALAKENKWRAQRYGLAADLADPFRESPSIAGPAAARRLALMLRPHAECLGCVGEIERVDEILARGTSADRQTAIYKDAISRGLSRPNALNQVKAWLQTETVAGCC
jgi:carboxylate-amine ligase